MIEIKGETVVIKKKQLLESWTFPIETVSEGNLFEHWSKANARHKKQKKIIRDKLFYICYYSDMPITIKLTRISPRKLDAHDNLRMAFKFIVDEIASMIYPGLKAGRADDTDMIEWEYAQEKGKPKEKGMRVEVYAR